MIDLPFGGFVWSETSLKFFPENVMSSVPAASTLPSVVPLYVILTCPAFASTTDDAAAMWRIMAAGTMPDRPVACRAAGPPRRQGHRLRVPPQ